MRSVPLTALLLVSGVLLAQSPMPAPQLSPAAATLPVGPIPDAEIDALRKKFNVPGVSVAVIRNFAVEWARAYGVADVESGAAVTTETMFQAASMSKPVAAMVSLKAVEDGRFSLDQHVNTILKSWKLPGDGYTADHGRPLARSGRADGAYPRSPRQGLRGRSLR